MINPAIETDLVGELVRVEKLSWSKDPLGKVVSRALMTGRVRAVTAHAPGYMFVWIEIVDEEGCRVATEDEYSSYSNVAIGDLFPTIVGGEGVSDDLGTRLHILRGTR